jgi:hypothetical protein
VKGVTKADCGDDGEKRGWKRIGDEASEIRRAGKAQSATTTCQRTKETSTRQACGLLVNTRFCLDPGRDLKGGKSNGSNVAVASLFLHDECIYIYLYMCTYFQLLSFTVQDMQLGPVWF